MLSYTENETYPLMHKNKKSEHPADFKYKKIFQTSQDFKYKKIFQTSQDFKYKKIFQTSQDFKYKKIFQTSQDFKYKNLSNVLLNPLLYQWTKIFQQKKSRTQILKGLFHKMIFQSTIKALQIINTINNKILSHISQYLIVSMSILRLRFSQRAKSCKYYSSV